MEHIMHPKVCWQCDSISSASYPFLNWVGSCKPGIQLGCGSPCLPVSTVDIDHITHLKLDVLVLPVILVYCSLLRLPDLLLEVLATLLSIHEVLEATWIIDS